MNDNKWPKDWPSKLDVVQTLVAAVENLRSADKDSERHQEAAWRIASSLEKLAKELWKEA